MNAKVISAIFRRNFHSYFSNPTGYVFICLFVWLCTGAAFFPNEFFNANLANLDQLNASISYVLLLFIPAITMSIWADERRLGTDELLLTMPAADLDVVLGKYLAAVAIFTVSLLFSLFSTLGVLYTLGQPDLGLFLTNFFGYWVMGLAMLAIGMVASFLTGNLTVAFILGLVFNAPLVMFNRAMDFTTNTQVASTLKEWSMDGQFRDFARGVISFSSLVYYFAIVGVALYLCMVLIGRRHWASGQDGKSLFGHYLLRLLALSVVAISAVVIFKAIPLHADTTANQLNTLSSGTREILKKLDPKRPVKIHAYVSPAVPQDYVQQRSDLLSLLRELESLGKGNVTVQVEEIEPLTEAARRAEQQYDIKPRRVVSRDRGAIRDQEIYMGVAFESGMQKVVVPFIDRNLPVEYELARSIATVNQEERKRVGVLKTGAEMFSGFDFSGGMPRQRQEQQIITELKKQYEVIEVDPTNAITEKYDVLLAIQPSSLNPVQMANFVEAVRNGQKTAVFEDPRPAWFGVVGTADPNRPQGGMMGMGAQPPEPKGDIKQLWNLLGIELEQKGSLLGAAEPIVVSQTYNPHKTIEGLSQVPPQLVFIDSEVPGAAPFNREDPTSMYLQEVLLPFVGALTKQEGATTNFIPLIRTGTRTGMIPSSQLMQQSDDPLANQVQGTGVSYVVAARVTGKPGKVDAAKKGKSATKAKVADDGKLKTENAKMEDAGSPEKLKSDAAKAAATSTEAAKKDDTKAAGIGKVKAGEEPPVDVVVVSDIDFIHDTFFALRAQQEADLALVFDNVTFVLNIVDDLAGEKRFTEVRSRRPAHRPLTAVENRMEKIHSERSEKIEELQAELNQEIEKTKSARSKSREAYLKKIEQLQKGDVKLSEIRDARTALELQESLEEQNFSTGISEVQRKYQDTVKKTSEDVLLQMRNIQDDYKRWAVIIPPLLPLAIGLLVFFRRRASEREGVSRARLK